jgi:phospholipid N-methyltransferase
MKSLFLTSFLRSPKQVGSIIPSSKSLTNKLVQNVSNEESGVILEFGAGTGVITRKLQQHYSNKRLILFEKDNILREYLKNQFPHLLV